ncbi:MAG: exodeoxyribonuclease VII small subunit [Lachnospira sp.]|nr:exodeoxyribonuclease VII small subunit [Lachnospira sp.]
MEQDVTQQMDEQEKKTPERLQEKFAQLDQILADLQKKDISLEEAFARYQEGVELVKQCNAAIDRVEKQVQVLQADTESEAAN